MMALLLKQWMQFMFPGIKDIHTEVYMKGTHCTVSLCLNLSFQPHMYLFSSRLFKH